MKKIILALACLWITFSSAQQHSCSKAKQSSSGHLLAQQAREANLSSLTSHELDYDVKFVHLDLHLERDTSFISGGVTIVATVTASVLDTFMTFLHQNHTIDSIRFNGALLSFIRQDSSVKVKMPVSLNQGNTFTVSIYYYGVTPVGGSAIGSGFSSAPDPYYGFNSEVTWSLSESLVAYHWWPCKQILTDKIDSSWVFVTTDSSNKVGSNGLLTQVVSLGAKSRYEWKSHNPIAFYLISVAIAQYSEYDIYAKPQYLPNDSILIQNYIYRDVIHTPFWTANDKVELDKLPKVMKLYCNLYGMYPFYKEKYGHCMAPFGGGEEHQTMTSIFGLLDYYVNAHELGHQWWGDNVTCQTWKDIWINEGFASYSEYLTATYLDPANLVSLVSADHGQVMTQPGGSVYLTNHDTVDATAIFDPRLTYAKGAAIIRTLQFVTNNDSLWFNTLRGFLSFYKNSTASVINFKDYYQAQTGIDPTQFFNQWYYGEGYPTFTVRYNMVGNTLVLKSTQTVSMPGTTPLFITPMEYKIVRVGHPDTTVRVMHSQATEIYSFSMTGTISTIRCDPSNWVINALIGPSVDTNLNTGIAVIPNAVSAMSIGPNPARSIFTLQNPAMSTGRVLVLDLAGKLILEKKLEEQTLLDLSHFAHGLYEVRVLNESSAQIFSRKIISE